jgi:hypothetical protein
LGSRRLDILEALGNVGDFIGGLAVVITLVYLAVQVRQNSRQIELNTRAVQAAAYQALLDSQHQATMESVRDKQLAELFLGSRDSLEKLDRVDRFRLDVLLRHTLRLRQHFFIQAQDGLIRADLLATNDAALVALLSYPAVQLLWARAKDQFHPGFAQHVDELLSKVARTPPAAQQGAAADEPQRVSIDLG